MIDPERQVAIEAIRAWVASAIGLRFDADRAATLDPRIDVVCRKLGLTATDLRQKLESGDQDSARSVAEEVSTNHTFFFREPIVFDYFRKTILPSLPTHEPLRVWSAAASSGEEAFSIAMIARETLGSIAAEARVRILGTDISQRQVRLAEQATYPRRALSSVPPTYERDFEPVGALDMRVRASVASLCVFRRMNLTQLPWPFQAKFHVIFLRNVLYYFDAPTQHRILRACADALEPGGWLVTSLTEPVADGSGGWTQVHPGVFRSVARDAR